jgi:hypothetical protein
MFSYNCQYACILFMTGLIYRSNVCYILANNLVNIDWKVDISKTYTVRTIPLN